MAEIIPVNYRSDILPEYRGTPVELLLEYHNLGRAIGSTPAPQLLIGMCMDSRKSLRVPNDFAFVLRTAGANMRDNEFRISYAIAVGGVRTIVLIAHTDCGMARLGERREQFIQGLMNAAGWDEARDFHPGGFDGGGGGRGARDPALRGFRAQVRHPRRGRLRAPGGRTAAHDLPADQHRAAALSRRGRSAVSATVRQRIGRLNPGATAALRGAT
jgi:hypothetical protein